MEQQQSWRNVPLPKIGLVLWLAFHITANIADAVPTLPGLASDTEWDEPRFQDEWRKWQRLRNEEADETRTWWLANARLLESVRTAVRWPFGWYLDLLGLSQQWDLFRAGTRLAPQLAVYGRVCRAPADCDSLLFFRYGDGGVHEELFENVRMRGLVYSWASDAATSSFPDGCRALAKHFQQTTRDLEEVVCELSLEPTPSPVRHDASFKAIMLKRERVPSAEHISHPPQAPVAK